MQPALEQYDVGVLVGRFQVHELHEAHRDLIRHVCEQHEKVIIFLGVAPLPFSTSNPLDFESRKQMILSEFPEVNVLYIKDHPSDRMWSKKLDDQIADLVLPGQSAVIYGGRDSFIAHYSGANPTRELLQETFVSGTEVRRSIARSSARNSADFRAGVIMASLNRFPTAYQCVDVAILTSDKQKLLLGRKSTDQLLRFPGGFSDPTSPDLESDARREAYEETGVEVAQLRYVGSTLVEDWRYDAEPDCIKTALFVGTYVHGRPNPSDDLDAEVRWVDLNTLKEEHVVPQHRVLLSMLDEYIQKENFNA